MPLIFNYSLLGSAQQTLREYLVTQKLRFWELSTPRYRGAITYMAMQQEDIQGW